MSVEKGCSFKMFYERGLEFFSLLEVILREQVFIIIIIFIVRGLLTYSTEAKYEIK